MNTDKTITGSKNPDLAKIGLNLPIIHLFSNFKY